MHDTSPFGPSALEVVARDYTTNYVTYPSLTGCVSPVDRTKGKTYLTLVGSYVHMGDISQIKLDI